MASFVPTFLYPCIPSTYLSRRVAKFTVPAYNILARNEILGTGIWGLRKLQHRRSKETQGKKVYMAVQETQRVANVNVGDCFVEGKYSVMEKEVRGSDTSKPPTELFIVSPVEEGIYPVLTFFHGFMLPNTWYTALLRHVASHGFILVAPKIYGLIPVSVVEAIKTGTHVIEWLSKGLPQVLPQKVLPDMNNLVLLGHSRGGKTAFALEEEYGRKAKSGATPPKFKALIGINPVAAFDKWLDPKPHILHFIPRSFDISIPVAVIGCELESQSLCLLPPFAPDGYNHSEFFNESKPPCAYFLAKGYGHCDVLDNKYANCLSYICKSVLNANRGPTGLTDLDLLRRSVGGIVVAFLRLSLEGKPAEFNDIVNDPTVVPAAMKPVIYVEQ